MNLEELQKSDRIIFSCLAGSRLYNLATKDSDFDLRGVFMSPHSEYLKIDQPTQQIHSEKQDTIYYDMKRFFELLRSGNPSCFELLWAPQKVIKISSGIWMKMQDNRSIFISKAAYNSYLGYSFGQIKKAKGKNKRVFNPQPEEKPKKIDFCKFNFFLSALISSSFSLTPFSRFVLTPSIP